MKLHCLAVTAFGPFVDTIEIDFDELSANGLFLLTGDTGAGKSSILDAVCFALYGEVPGDRQAAHHLHSDHADPSRAPEVVLRLSIGARTFRFTRSPAWTRPKRRGAGTVRIQAHVLVEEQVRDRDGSDHWRALTHRLDEAGHLVTELLGMTRAQFTQVALLPQNKFQEFLRASSAERQAVLQRLFRTRRFEDVERWLVERRVRLHRRSQRCHDHTAVAVNRLIEAAGDLADWPEDWDTEDVSAVADGLHAWADGVRRRAVEEAAASARQLRRTTRSHAAARTALEHAQQVSRSRARGEAALAELADLDSSRERDRELAAMLEAYGRAAPLIPLIRRASATADTLERVQESADRHLEPMAVLLDADPGAIDGVRLSLAATEAAEARAVAESWLPREEALVRDEAELASQVDEVAALRESLEQLCERLDVATTHRSAVQAQLASASAAARTLPQDEALEASTRAAWQAAREAGTLRARLDEQRRLLSQATARSQDLRTVYLDRREARISGMAAELAQGLAVGCSCPVCGSAEHPAPATARVQVTRADEDAARQEYESADFERQTVQEVVTTTSARLEVAVAGSEDRPAAYWEVRATQAATAAAAGRQAREQESALRDQATEVDLVVANVEMRLAAVRATLGEREAALLRRCEDVARARAELDRLLEPTGCVSVSALVAAYAARQHAVTEACAALDALERARAEHDAALADVVSTVRDAGFASGREALVAHLPPARVEALSVELDESRVRRASACAVLEEPDVRAAAGVPEPDLVALSDAAEAAARNRDAALAVRDLADRRRTRTDVLVRDLERALVEWQPVREQLTLTAGLAALVEGKGSDNALRMRLSAYVLGERLRQVVAAANERLAVMTGQRYLLEQSDERAAGEQRGGLSLRMCDQWSGKRRDPATLSGGETFLVSLALALGLADTVSHEAGGTQLDTLFIDEGFGALDAATLDGVMDTLDSLRDGGRVVGLVSHVAELRTRVTTQLEVRKSRTGSTVRSIVVCD